MEIWALSGFLGLPMDWDFLQREDLVAVDWQRFPLHSLPGWGRAFNEWVSDQESKHHFRTHFKPSSRPRVLLGYSLGGRLALHALIDRSELWDAAIIISSHPGFIHDHERSNRQQGDREWANRFESEEWDHLMETWNGQDVFKGDSFSFQRKESDYQRNHLIEALVGGSLGAQRDLRGQIGSLSLPILWVNGKLDSRYCQIAQTITFSHPLSRWKCIENAGHRVPWSEPRVFCETVDCFLQDLFFKQQFQLKNENLLGEEFPQVLVF